MEIFVACGHWDYEGFHILGVFDSEDKAKELLAEDKHKFDDYSVAKFLINDPTKEMPWERN